MASIDSRSRYFDGLRHGHPGSTHLYLVRHGQTPGNVNHQLIGHTDMPLDELGVRQADQVGERMQSVMLDGIVCSPLQRARVTALSIARRHQLKLMIDLRLMEMNFGHAEGMTMAEAASRFPAVMALDADPLAMDFQWPGGDLRARFHANVFRTFTDLAISWRDRHVAVVCHGGVIGSLIAQLDGGSPNDYAAYPVPNCSVTHLEVHAEGTTAHLLNDITHLDAVRTEPFNVTIPAELAKHEPTGE